LKTASRPARAQESRSAQKLILLFAVILSLAMILLPGLDRRFG
jgi:hypothetical protein